MNEDSKQGFRDLVDSLTSALGNIEVVYPRMIDAAAPFDRELVKRLEAAKKADSELLQYVRSKAEAGHQLPPTVVVGLLGR